MTTFLHLSWFGTRNFMSQENHNNKVYTSTFITMQGADAILDCKGFKIFGSNVDPLSLAVRLTNGASAINCPIGNVNAGILTDGTG